VILFDFSAACAGEAALEGLDAAARKGRHGGRPPVITDGMLHTVLRCRANGETVETIQPTCSSSMSGCDRLGPQMP
jgi:hypothetical protein